MDNINFKKIIIIGAVVLGLIGFIIFQKIKVQNSNNGNNNSEIKLVDNYSEFFTIDDCINRYIDYLSSGENDKLVNVLNNDFMNVNDINKDNVVNKLDTLSLRNNIVSFKAKKMYVKKLSNNVNEYYVSGKIYEETDEDILFISDYYLIVNTYKKEDIFDVTPYDGKIFKEGYNG